MYLSTSAIDWQFITSILRQYKSKMGDREWAVEGGGEVLIVKHMYSCFLWKGSNHTSLLSFREGRGRRTNFKI